MYFWIVRKVSRLTKLIGSLFFIGILWSMLFIGKLLFSVPNNNNQNYIPTDATVVLTVDIHRLFERGFEDIVLKEQDNSTLQSIMQFIKEKEESGIETGIDYNSNLIYFIIERDGTTINGTLLNLYDANSFSENIRELISPNDVFLVKSNVGLILSDPSFGSSPNTLNAIGQSIMKDEQNNGMLSMQKIDPMITLSIEKSNPITKKGAGILMGGEVLDNMIQLEGQFIFPKDSTPINNSFVGLEPDGFHLSSQFIPQLLNDSIESFLGISLPKINSLSLNFRGTELVEEPGFAIVPDLDLLLHFDTEFNVDTILNKLSLQDQIEKITTSTFLYENRMFYFEKTSPKSLYLGKKKFEKTRIVGPKQLILMQGDIKAISSVNGKGMMRKLLELVSIYTSGRSFTEATKSIDVSLVLMDDKIAEFDGSITFKEGHQAINEIIKLLINGKLL